MAAYRSCLPWIMRASRMRPEPSSLTLWNTSWTSARGASQGSFSTPASALSWSIMSMI